MVKKKWLNDYKEDIVKKYSYDDELAEDIVVLADSVLTNLTEERGEFSEELYDVFEPIVFEAISNTKFIKAKTTSEKGQVPKDDIYGTLVSENLIDGEDLVSKARYQGLKSVYIAKPSLDKESNIVDITRTIVVPSRFSYTNPNTFGDVVPSMLRLIDNYKNGFSVKKGKLYERVGFETNIYDIKSGNKIFTKGSGLETGFNLCDEESIMSDFKDKYTAYGNSYLKSICTSLNDHLKEQRIYAQIMGESEEFKKALSSFDGGLDKLIEQLDYQVQLDEERKINFDNNDATKVILEEQKENADIVLSSLKNAFEEEKVKHI